MIPYKPICYLTVLAMCAVLTSCNDDDGDSRSLSGHDGDFTMSELTITGVSQPYDTESSDLVIYETDNNVRLRCGTYTAFRKQRPSCSGFNNVNYFDINVGDLVEVSYDLEKSDITHTPRVLKVLNIQAWRDECLHPVIIVTNEVVTNAVNEYTCTPTTNSECSQTEQEIE